MSIKMRRNIITEVKTFRKQVNQLEKKLTNFINVLDMGNSEKQFIIQKCCELSIGVAKLVISKPRDICKVVVPDKYLVYRIRFEWALHEWQKSKEIANCEDCFYCTCKADTLSMTNSFNKEAESVIKNLEE